jgi:hypothetical protein
MNTKDFQWTDELVKEFMVKCLSHQYHGDIDAFKASKTNPKEYEILSYRNFKSGNNEIHTKKSVSGNPIYFNGFDDNTGEFSRQDCFEIHSVKRLSDGEVFSIGDEVIVYGRQLKIKRMFLNLKDRKDDGYADDLILSALDQSNFQKAKKKLFTTTDNVDVFEGDRYYVVLTKEGLGFEPYSVAWCGQGSIEGANYENDCKIFSAKEKAEEYILLNKPVLSIQSIIDNWYDGQERKELHLSHSYEAFIKHLANTEIMKRIKRIAQSKIKPQ